MKRKSFGLLLLLFIVLASEMAVQTAEGRMCESQSHGFKGTCMRSHNCALVCRNEGFSGGRCRGFHRRCFCTKLC
ncbi:defensin-like protein 1 [Prosopis cineraria]|uniref:defensin-like protein 1 n=1 Tax=Prosopis cineraria TaxID=364024 RepID=UPI00240FCA85|nr:defensin-like protein 1 [Prosopis cineraria]